MKCTQWMGAGLAVLLLIQTGAAPAATQAMKPNLKFPTLAAYEQEIKEAGVMLDGEHVVVFAPRRFESAARTIQDYLNKAYAELYRVVGVDTNYKIVVYHLPPGNPNAKGGTSACVIYYDYSNLDLAQSEEWTRYHVPHVSGYIEEMAHNFVDATHAQFGWEMTGWTIGIETAMKVAGNPILAQSLAETRRRQSETFARYRQSGFTFPSDLAPNQCDRIHAYLLWQCEQKYGPNFWPDYFTQVRKESRRFADAVQLSGDDRIRNARYRLSIECFDRLPGLEFKKLLAENGVSLNVAVQSLHPTDAGWNRKLIGREPELAVETAQGAPVAPSVDVAALPPLHKAIYAGEGYVSLIDGGADVNAKGPHDWTPLHLAALGGHQGACEYLTGKGADVNAKDDEGRTPAELAKLAQHPGTEAFLRSKEAGKRGSN